MVFEKTVELRGVYRELIAEHLAMRAKLDAAMRTFKGEFKRCRPEDEAALAAKFRAILDTLDASVAAVGPIAAQRLESL